MNDCSAAFCPTYSYKVNWHWSGSCCRRLWIGSAIMRTYVSFRHIFLRVKTFKDMLFAANQDTHKCKKHRRRHRRHLQTDLFWLLIDPGIYRHARLRRQRTNLRFTDVERYRLRLVKDNRNIANTAWASFLYSKLPLAHVLSDFCFLPRILNFPKTWLTHARLAVHWQMCHAISH